MSLHRQAAHRGATGALLAVALLLVLVAGVAPAAAQTRDDPSYIVKLISQSPYVHADETFTMVLDIDGALPTDRITVDIWSRAGRLGTADRRSLRAAFENDDPDRADLVKFGAPASATYDTALNLSTGYATLTIPANRFNLPGVYPLTVQMQRDGHRSPVLLTTTLVRLDDATVANPLDIAFVLPVTARLAHRPDGTTTVPQADLTRLGALSARFSTGALASVRLSLEPNPETIDALAAAAADGAGDAGRLLADLVRLAGNRHVLATTYVPANEEALRRQGLDFLVIDLQSTGTQVLERTFGAVDGSVAHSDPSDTADTVVMRREFGADTLLIPDHVLTPLDEARFPATVLQSFELMDRTGAQIRALATDSHVAQLARELDSAPRDARPLLAQRLLADLLAGYFDHAQSDNPRATVVVLPDDLDPAGPIIDVLLELSRLPQVQLTTVEDALTSVSPASPLGGARAETPAGGPLVRTLRSEAAPDLGGYAAHLGDAERELRAFESLIDAPAGAYTADLKLLRLLSADDRLDALGRARYVDALQDAIRTRLRAPDGGPGLVGPGTQRVTMTSRRATIPIQIDNRLAFPVTVRLEMKSEKLSFPDGFLRDVKLAPGMNTIDLNVEAKTSGDSLLEIAVHPREPASGLGTLASGSFTVRSTALSGLGLVISAVALTVLVVWWIRHALRTRRQRRDRVAEPAATAPATAPPVADEAPPADAAIESEETPTLTRSET